MALGMFNLILVFLVFAVEFSDFVFSCRFPLPSCIFRSVERPDSSTKVLDFFIRLIRTRDFYLLIIT